MTVPYDCLDIDALVAEIAAGNHSPLFDLTGDGLVNLGDRDAWLAPAGEINLGPGRVFLVGDATLDGFVDVQDFNEWNANRFTIGAAWCRGDFNADGVVDVQDFNAWNKNKFQTSDRAIQSLWPTTRRDPQPMETNAARSDRRIRPVRRKPMWLRRSRRGLGLQNGSMQYSPRGVAVTIPSMYAPKVVPLEKLSPTSSSFPWVTR